MKENRKLPVFLNHLDSDQLEFGGKSQQLLLARYDASTFTAMTIKGFILKHHRSH